MDRPHTAWPYSHTMEWCSAIWQSPFEIFGRVRDANGHACYEVRVCGVAREVKTDHLSLLVPWRLSSAARADTVIVPGVADLHQTVPPAIFRVLGSCRGKRRPHRIDLICTGAFLLARAGLLEGLHATTHWKAADVVREPKWTRMSFTWTTARC